MTEASDIADAKKRLDYIEKIVILGNGEPALKETVKHNKNWIDANLGMPVVVQKHSDYFGTFTRLGWIVVTVSVGISLQFGCAFSLGVFLLLNAFGLLKVP